GPGADGMRAQLLPRFHRADEAALHAVRCGTRAAEKSCGVPARKSGCQRRRDREKDLRSWPRKLRQARQDFSASVSIDSRPGAWPAAGRVHSAGHAGPHRRTAQRNDRSLSLDEFGEHGVGYLQATIAQFDSAAIERQQPVVEQWGGHAAEDAFEVAAEALVKIGQREAFPQPQIEEHEFALRSGLIDRLGAGLRVIAL